MISTGQQGLGGRAGYFIVQLYQGILSTRIRVGLWGGVLLYKYNYDEEPERLVP